MFKIICVFIILSYNLFGYSNVSTDINRLFDIVNDKQEIIIDGITYEIDLRKLIQMTAIIESNYGRDNYNNRVAKTYMQIEENTAKCINSIPEITNFLEDELGHKIIWNQNNSAVCTVYLIYLYRLKYYFHWINKYKDIFYQTNDLEWFIYKLFYNSIHGHSTYKKWKYRINQGIKEGIL